MQWNRAFSRERILAYALNAASFVIEVLKFNPDPIQTQILTRNPSRLILNCTRQWGKSTTAALLALHRALTRANSLVLIIAPAGRQSNNVIRKIRQILRSAGLTRDAKRGSSSASKDPSISFTNGSEIIALPGDPETTRSFSAVSLLIIDEAAYVPDTLYYSFRPTLAVSRGNLAVLSTPAGKRGFFYNEFEFPTENFHKVSVKATDCPRIPKDFLEIEMAKGEDYYAQEYDCQFVENGEYLFGDDLIRNLLKKEVAAIAPPPSTITLKRPVVTKPVNGGTGGGK
jgi:hypothetical protein